jgi:hypothetical protein
MHLNSPIVKLRWYDYIMVAFAAGFLLYLLVWC